MHIFSRSVRLGLGDYRKQMDWALRITEKVNQISETRFGLWTVVMSPGFGTLKWGAAVTSLGELEAIDDKLAADNGYLDLVAEGASHVIAGSIDDTVTELIHADPTVQVDRAQYMELITARALPGHTLQAAEVGVKIAQRGAAAAGVPCSFGRRVTGPMGQFQWVSYYESIAQYERTQNVISSDPELLYLIEQQAPNHFGPEVPVTLVRKIV